MAPVSGAAPVAPVAPSFDPPKPRRVDYAPTIATLKREIPLLMAEGGAVGLTIALVDGKRTVWKRGFGLANRERGWKVTRKTLFHIGSTSKTMTAMAIMQLVERGLVDLDAPLTDYVPGFRMRPRYRHNVVTVRSIMTHHSGIPGDSNKLAEFGKRPDSGMYRKVKRQLRTELPVRRVGEAWAYSNLGITMLQGIVEHVSGMSFQQYTRRHIFKPAGMISSSFDDSVQSARHVAAAYEVQTPGQAAVRRPREYVNIRPAGSVYSNGDDMARYLKAMVAFGRAPTGERLLRSGTVQQMITPQPKSPWDKKFWEQGLVWWIGYGTGWPDAVNHGGDTYYHHSMAAWLPDDRLGVFVSVNTATSNGVTGLVWQRALGLMREAKTGVEPPQPVTPAPVGTPKRRELLAAAGRYANFHGILDVAVAGDLLKVTPSAQVPGAPSMLLSRRRDGWYSQDAATPSLRPTTIEGQRVLLVRTPDGLQGLSAQELPGNYRVPKAWRNREGLYLLRGVSPNSYPMAPGPILLPVWVSEGVLLLGNQVLRPASGKVAFTFGPTPLQVMRDAGFALEARGAMLRFQGAQLVRVGPAPAAPRAAVTLLSWPVAPTLAPSVPGQP